MRRLPARLFDFYWGEGIADDVPALTYYLVLSLAPFALGVAALQALLLESTTSALEVAGQVNRYLPEQVHGDVQRLVLGVRDDSTKILLISLVAMLWTSSGAIGVIERCESRILGCPRHHVALGRLWNLGLGAVVAAAVVLASGSTSVVTDVSGTLHLDRWAPSGLLLALNAIGSVVLVAVIFRYAPRTRMGWRSSLLGAVPAGLALQAVPAVVGLYVSAAAGLQAVRLFLLLAVILLGLYIMAMVLLLGAGAAAHAERRTRRSDGTQCEIDENRGARLAPAAAAEQRARGPVEVGDLRR
jgi:YihY family inner membrane protein